MENKIDIIVNELYLQDYWSNLLEFNSEDTVDFYRSQLQFIDVFKKQLVFDGDINGLYLKNDVWRLSINPDSLQNIINIPIVIGLLNYLGYTQIAGVVIPVIFQSLFKIEHIRVSKKDESIFINLPLKNENIYKTPEEWHSILPKKYQKMVDRLEFLDIMENFVRSGLAREKDGKYLIITKGNNRFYFSFLS